ncbi:MAG: glycosyltransferase, partial [Phycisphaerae bacterium]|nr:glycosyltransferase [Phycisphaerae bacterium]
MLVAAAYSPQWWDTYLADLHDVDHDGAVARQRGKRLRDHLPGPELAHIKLAATSLAYVGCEYGEKLAAFVEICPQARVTGLDFAGRAIRTARRQYTAWEFELAREVLRGEFDVVIVDDRLQYADRPLVLLESYLRSCQNVAVVRVSLGEGTSHAGRSGTFDSQSLPEQLGDFRRLHLAVVEASEDIGAARELIAVYGAPRYVTQRLERENARLRAELTETQKRHAELHAWTEQLDGAFTEKSLQCEDLQAQLRSITEGTGWSMLQTLRRVRFAIFPHGSLRERAARWCMHKQRRFRFHARQGPCALLRAGGGWVARPFKRHAAERTSARPEGTPAGEGEAALSGLVTVVLPVYNQADMLAESIESVLAQTYPDFELVVVNDGSTDGVEQVLDKYVGHPKVRLVSQVNQRLPKALTNGFEFARGGFRTWTSADNLMEPEHLEKHVAFLRSHPDVAMVHSDYLAIDDRGEPLNDPSFRAHNRRPPESPIIHLPRSTEDLTTRDDNFIGACFMYRDWVGRMLGEYAPNMGVEDYDYWMRMDTLFTIQHLGTDDVLYRYRVHDNTLCAHAAEHRIAQHVRRLMEHQQERAAFYRRPWTVYADDATRAWLNDVDAAPHAVRDLAELDGGVLPEDKTLVLVRADNLPALAKRELPAGCCVAAWFAADDELAPYERFAEVQQVVDVCFASTPRMLERLGVFTRRAFHAEPGPMLLDRAVTFANANVWYDRTVPAAARRRVLPAVHQPADRRLRVLLQVRDFVQGGFEQVVLDIAAVLDKKRFDVSVLVLGQEGPAAVAARGMGAHVLTLGAGERDECYRELLREHEFDVINAHFAPYGAAIASELGIPFVQTIHSTYIWLTEQQLAEVKAADPHTHAYLCVSAAAAMYADERHGLGTERMVIVPNGINGEAIDQTAATLDRDAERAAMGFGPDDLVLLETASIYPPKGQILLLQALAKVTREHPRLKVAFLGRAMDQAYTQKVHAEAERLGLNKSVCFLGYRPQPHKYYNVCDAFVLPTFCEGWSLALGEAVYAGLPVITTDVGAARDLLTRAGGHL